MKLFKRMTAVAASFAMMTVAVATNYTATTPAPREYLAMSPTTVQATSTPAPVSPLPVVDTNVPVSPADTIVPQVQDMSVQLPVADAPVTEVPVAQESATTVVKEEQPESDLTDLPSETDLPLDHEEEEVLPAQPQEVSRVYEAASETVTVTSTLSEAQAQAFAVTPSAVSRLFPDTMAGYMTAAYDVKTADDFEQATLSFELPLLEGYVDPTVYYFSEQEQTLVPLETTVDGQTASATVSEAATYILLDRVLYEGSLTWEDEWAIAELYDCAEVVLVMDDSGSMLTTDPENHRLSFAADWIDRLPQNSNVGIVRFSRKVDILTPELTDRETAKSYLTTEHFCSDGGTAMFTAVQSALSLYSDTTYTQKVMVVLTDGLSVDAFAYDEIVSAIADKNIKVYMIGYDEIPHYTSQTPAAFAEDVSGVYYSAVDTAALEAAYIDVSKRIDLSLDTDGDTIPDYYEDHIVAFNGVSIPLDKTKVDTDDDGIPDNEEVSVTLVYSDDGTKVYVKGVLLSDPGTSDSDGDGIPDGDDATPYDNIFTGTLTSEYSSGDVMFQVDFSHFFGDNTVYDPLISEFSALLSAVAYEKSSLSVYDMLNTHSIETYNVSDVLAYFGMQGTRNYILADDYDDIHVSEVTVGYRNITANGELRTVLAVVVRGTNATIEEWSSNCDIGELAKDTADDDWVNTLNHKGFDIAATRIKRFLAQYIEENGLHADALTYWVTGHSRGAAIANIIGADLEKEGKRTFVYTFATPANTLATDAASYRTIFNVINQDDFVPCLPIASWGYTRYGRSTTNVSIKASYEKIWKDFTGISSYKTGVNNMDSRVETIGKILTSGMDPRVDCYRYTCDCHGDGTNDTITIKNTGMSEDSREKAIAKIPQNALPTCAITRYEGGWIGGWDFEVCQTPAYFMQLLAAFMAKEIDAYRFAVELNIADRYENAKSALVGVGLEGAEHPHYAETYYVLAENVTAAAFE